MHQQFEYYIIFNQSELVLFLAIRISRQQFDSHVNSSTLYKQLRKFISSVEYQLARKIVRTGDIKNKVEGRSPLTEFKIHDLAITNAIVKNNKTLEDLLKWSDNNWNSANFKNYVKQSLVIERLDDCMEPEIISRKKMLEYLKARIENKLHDKFGDHGTLMFYRHGSKWIKEIVAQVDEDMSPFYVNFKEDEYLEGQCTGECEIIYPQDIPNMKYKDLHEVHLDSDFDYMLVKY